MNSKTLIIFKSPILFEILEEIKENFNFDIFSFNQNEISEKFLSKFNDYIIISNFSNNIENCNIIATPSKLEKILEKINIWFLSSKFSSQSKIKIGGYFLNLNSRQISKNKVELNLTEKETELILFIMTNEFVSLKDLQKKVWKHSSELETHTVETHIYRLRKKFLEKFNDEEFIKHDKRGYYLK
tara:strand:- start:2179 stop:2733 length:555 start_codon:yes stop_codon:yes gene_type:complete